MHAWRRRVNQSRIADSCAARAVKSPAPFRPSSAHRPTFHQNSDPPLTAAASGSCNGIPVEKKACVRGEYCATEKSAISAKKRPHRCGSCDRCCSAPPQGRVGTQQALVRHVKPTMVTSAPEWNTHGRQPRILDDIRFRGRVPADLPAASVRPSSPIAVCLRFPAPPASAASTRQSVGRSPPYRDVAAVFTDHIDDESHTFPVTQGSGQRHRRS